MTQRLLDNKRAMLSYKAIDLDNLIQSPRNPESPQQLSVIQQIARQVTPITQTVLDLTYTEPKPLTKRQKLREAAFKVDAPEAIVQGMIQPI